MADIVDVLTLAGMQFTGYSTPNIMGAGGRQAMVVHKLPGGTRVIDTLGPDEDEIRWAGHLFQNDAIDFALRLDALRASGNVVPLTFAGQYRSVIVSQFSWMIRRHPVWLDYAITCTVVSNPSFGLLSRTTTTIGSMVLSDLGAAIGL